MTKASGSSATLKELDRTRLDDTLFDILNDHLNGVARGILRARLEDLCNDQRVGGKDALTLYNEAHISRANVNKLKRALRITEEFKEPDTLFGWIKLLSQKNYAHRHLEDFYHLLQEVKPRKSWAIPLFITTLFSAIGAIFLGSKAEHLEAFERLIARITPVISQFFSATFSVLKNIPLLLFIYSVLCIPAQAFQTIFRDNFRSNLKRFQKWITGTLPAAMNLVSYGLCYAAGGVFTPVAIAFFVTSSFITVLSSLFNFYQLKQIGGEPHKTASLEEQLDYIRQKERQARTVQTIGVNFAASILVSICVILWGVLPPSFSTMISCIIFINLVGFTKNAMLNHIHTQGAESLQKELREEFVENKAPTEAKPQPKPDSTQIILEQLEKTNQEIKQLAEEVQTLKQTLQPEKPKGWLEWLSHSFTGNREEQVRNTYSLT